MSDRFHTALIILCSLATLWASISLLSVQVSLKYEAGVDGCLSTISGRDLCASYSAMQWVAGTMVVAILLLLIGFSNQLIRKK